ncbi:MAG: hypothetical protein ACPG40_07075 [Alphaproteobacteria bacterium]
MYRVIVALGAGMVSLLSAGLAQAHPYTTWKEDGMSSDAHTHVNSGDYNFTGQQTTGTLAVTRDPSGYFTEDGIWVTSSGYYLNDGTYIEGRYVEGSVFNGGAVEGNTIITGGGIVSLYGFEETRTTTTSTTTASNASASLNLTAEQRGGGVKIQADGTPYYCWCAYSASGERVPVYAVASPNASIARHYVGGGTKTFDVESYYDGFWKVSWRESGGGVQYGWVREEDVACKRTLSR